MASPLEMKIIGWKIYLSHILGKGAYGTVYKADDESGKTAAAKEIDGERHPKVLCQNFDKLLELNHTNIVSISGIHKENNTVWMFLEFCQFGDLNNYFYSKDPTIDQVFDIMIQMANGLEYLHGKDIIHRDIKPGNILIASESPLLSKLADFDVSKCLNPEAQISLMSSDVGTEHFQAPEFFQPNEEQRICYSRNVDVYATGLTYLAMLQYEKGKRYLKAHIETPQEESEFHIPIGRLIAERIRFKKPKPQLNVVSSDVSPIEAQLASSSWAIEIRNLIGTMTSHIAKERPSASDVVRALRHLKRLSLPKNWFVPKTLESRKDETSSEVISQDDVTLTVQPQVCCNDMK